MHPTFAGVFAHIQFSYLVNQNPFTLNNNISLAELESAIGDDVVHVAQLVVDASVVEKTAK